MQQHGLSSTRPPSGRFLTLSLFVTLAGPLVCLTPHTGLAIQVTGLDRPHSILSDPETGYYYISSTGGEDDAKDNNGFITKVDAEGKIVQQRFVHSDNGGITLHAPKGMAIIHRTLYVADIDAVRGFDTETGRAVVTIAVGARRHSDSGDGPQLTDVAGDGKGVLFVSDTRHNAIYRIDTIHDHAVSLLVQDDQLAGPHGLAIHPRTGHVIAVSFEKGAIFEVTPEGIVTVIEGNSFFTSRFRNLDGVDFDRWGNMYVSDFTAGKIWRMRPDRRFQVIAEFLPFPADIGVDRKNNLILVPYQMDGVAEMNGLEAPSERGKEKKRTLADYGFVEPPTKEAGK